MNNLYLLAKLRMLILYVLRRLTTDQAPFTYQAPFIYSPFLDVSIIS